MFTEFWSNIGVLEQVLWAVLVCSTLLQMFYFLFFFTRITKKQPTINTGFTPPVSVIICAKNEEKNIRNLVPTLMSQDYPNFEVVIVNDGSWDDSLDTLEALKITYPKLRIVDIPEEGLRMKGKKLALTLGIKGAKHERLLLTDADCTPTSQNWMREMIGSCEEDNDIILGYSPYLSQPGLLNKIIRFDTFFIGLQYLSFAKAGMPYMGVGRNLSYTKKAFFDVGGFRKHSFLQSGDDDLFVNQIANKKNTRVRYSMESHMKSIPKENWKDWWYQKKRHLSTAPHYKKRQQLLLALFPLTYVLFLAAGITLLCLHTKALLVIPFFLLRYGLQILIFKLSSRQLGESKLVWLSPIWELALMTLNPLLYFSNTINKPAEWN